MIFSLTCGSGQIPENQRMLEYHGCECRVYYESERPEATMFCVHPTGTGLVVQEQKPLYQYPGPNIQTSKLVAPGQAVFINTAPETANDAPYGYPEAMADVAQSVEDRMRAQYQEAYGSQVAADAVTLLQTQRDRAGMPDPKAPPTAEAAWNLRHPASTDRSFATSTPAPSPTERSDSPVAPSAAEEMDGVLARDFDSN